MPVYEAKPNVPILVALIVVGVALVVGVGLVLITGGTLSPSLQTSSSTASTLPSNVVEVTMKGAGNGLNYQPAKIVVVIGVNNTVVWVNDDSVPHTVTARSVPSGAQNFDSGNMPPGQSFKYTFTVPGNYTYYCVYHPWMVGTVIVLAGGPQSSGSSANTTTTQG